MNNYIPIVCYDMYSIPEIKNDEKSLQRYDNVSSSLETRITIIVPMLIVLVFSGIFFLTKLNKLKVLNL